MAAPRIYLTGRVAIESGSTLLEERHLAGRQGRLAFAYLMTRRHSAVGRDDLRDVLWPDGPPPEADTALNAILSKLRGALKKGAFGDAAGIDVRLGAVHVRLPRDTWIDAEAAVRAIDEAEGALRSGDTRHAWGCAAVAVGIGRRPFLPHEEAPWIEAQRRTLRMVLVRGLHCLSTLSAAMGDRTLAVLYASQLVELEPFRETAYQQLMRAHADAGDRAEALRVFARCRDLLREELGTSPSPHTEAVYLQILRDSP